MESIDASRFISGQTLLNDIAYLEYAKSIQEIVNSRERKVAFLRIGRSMSVCLKAPFARSYSYDVNSPGNWAKSRLYWEVRSEPTGIVLSKYKSEVDLLIRFSAEWERPVEYLGEFNIFHSLCKALRPLFCDESKTLKKIEEVSEEIRKQGNDLTLISKNQALGVASVTAASYFMQSIPWLNESHLPVVTGLTLFSLCFTQRQICKYATEFLQSYDPNKDFFLGKEFERCGSKDTNDRSPCRNRVRSNGQKCWIHRDKDEV